MNNLEQYDEIFMETFGVEKSALNESFINENVDAWDSIGHMNLLAELEEAFDITLDDDDLMNFESYEGGKDILKKYGVNFD
ncbi:acyl carrier protein [Agathobacter ruminis]|uniref:Acyl carrier protein n=1 Tax=Agathobacter ruminis TaxID=1712665 RepID=A0A2G3E4K4_9FIRM|nr:acyl carrier protein [Agathobacter ruminis]MDC7302044.1 acyl carrier protein [Agathobacter ruminis]PHU38212.1 acyl carrier protein [Agathobacter ruminis]